MTGLAYAIRRAILRAVRRWQREQRRRSRHERELALAVAVGRYDLNRTDRT